MLNVMVPRCPGHTTPPLLAASSSSAPPSATVRCKYSSGFRTEDRSRPILLIEKRLGRDAYLLICPGCTTPLLPCENCFNLIDATPLARLLLELSETAGSGREKLQYCARCTRCAFVNIGHRKVLTLLADENPETETDSMVRRGRLPMTAAEVLSVQVTIDERLYAERKTVQFKMLQSQVSALHRQVMAAVGKLKSGAQKRRRRLQRQIDPTSGSNVQASEAGDVQTDPVATADVELVVGTKRKRGKRGKKPLARGGDPMEVDCDSTAAAPAPAAVEGTVDAVTGIEKPNEVQRSGICEGETEVTSESSAGQNSGAGLKSANSPKNALENGSARTGVVVPPFAQPGPPKGAVTPRGGSNDQQGGASKSASSGVAMPDIGTSTIIAPARPQIQSEESIAAKGVAQKGNRSKTAPTPVSAVSSGKPTTVPTTRVQQLVASKSKLPVTLAASSVKTKAKAATPNTTNSAITASTKTPSKQPGKSSNHSAAKGKGPEASGSAAASATNPSGQKSANPTPSGPKCGCPVPHLSSHAAKKAKKLGKHAPALNRSATIAQNPVDANVVQPSKNAENAVTQKTIPPQSNPNTQSKPSGKKVRFSETRKRPRETDGNEDGGGEETGDERNDTTIQGEMHRRKRVRVDTSEAAETSTRPDPEMIKRRLRVFEEWSWEARESLCAIQERRSGYLKPASWRPLGPWELQMMEQVCGPQIPQMLSIACSTEPVPCAYNGTETFAAPEPEGLVRVRLQSIRAAALARCVPWVGLLSVISLEMERLIESLVGTTDQTQDEGSLVVTLRLLRRGHGTVWAIIEQAV
ncbi:hypothetical protein BJ742DRAFT_139012 [Cladochytrium replicatum]|nr:hypothetical protein BJ742DRAFT_139012 [Cladochytrium replicatum]